MNIAVLGANGMVGAEVVAEARNRGHEVEGFTRSGAQGTRALDLSDAAAVAQVVDSHDVTVISVAGRDNYEAVLKAHQDLIAAAPQGKLVVVGGAGALEIDGVRLVDSEGFPEEYKPEALTFGQVLDAYRASEGLEWTVIAPSPEIAPGVRTGDYVTALDNPAGGFVSTQDFAVALVDEIENPQFAGKRFTVASAQESAARG